MPMMWSYFGTTEGCQELHDDMVASRMEVVAVDVETISIKDRTPVGLSIATRRDEAFYWPIGSPMLPWHLLADDRIMKVYHNALFDLEVLLQYTKQRTDVPVVDTENIGDTTVIANILNMPRKLSDIAPYVGAMSRDMKVVLGKHKTTEGLSEDVIARKCCEDSTATMAVWEELYRKVDREYYNMEVTLLPILLMMTMRGIMVDQELRKNLQDELETSVKYYLDIAHGMWGLNPGSPQQVGYMLIKHGERLPFRNGKASTSKEVLMKLTSPIAALVLNYRRANKLLSTYVRTLEGQERAYSRFHMNAITGRISSTSLNLQNIPKSMRRMYMPDRGVFTDFDYSQIELRILAYLSGDRMMGKIYEMGGDIHQATADALGIARNPTSKNTNFAMIYGATVSTVAETAHVSVNRAGWLLKRWFETYPGAAAWIEEVQNAGLRDGYVVTIGGRKIVLPVGDENDMAVMRKAVSYTIQGSAAEIMKRAMLACGHLPVVLQIYDQLLFDGRVVLPEGLEVLGGGTLVTPLEVRETERWE